MKKLKKIALVLTLLSLMACSNDAAVSNDLDLSANLTGTWDIEIYTYEGHRTHTLNDAVWFTEYQGIGWEMYFDMVITDDPNNFSISGPYLLDLYYTDENGDSWLYFDNRVMDESGTWIRNGNQLTMDFEGDVRLGFISELTEDRLTLVINSNRTVTEPDNTLVRTTRSDTYTFRRRSD